MRLGVYMGSFNPPHNGHLKVINYLLENNYVDNILVVPTLNYWNKQSLAPIIDRINMLKFFENDYIKIDSKNNHYIYTIELMKALEKQYPNDKLYLIIGADNILSFDKWKNYQELLKYPIIVMNRNNLDLTNYLKKLKSKNFIFINNYPYIDISSSEIRNNLENKELDEKVLKYIKKRGLYQ